MFEAAVTLIKQLQHKLVAVPRRGGVPSKRQVALHTFSMSLMKFGGQPIGGVPISNSSWVLPSTMKGSA